MCCGREEGRKGIINSSHDLEVMLLNNMKKYDNTQSSRMEWWIDFSCERNRVSINYSHACTLRKIWVGNCLHDVLKGPGGILKILKLFLFRFILGKENELTLWL